VPTEAKSMGEVMPAPVAVGENPATVTEVGGHTSAPATTSEPVPAIAAAAPTVTATEPKPKEETLLAFPAPLKEEEVEEPRGLWGGFWRRRNDD
jgi:hypothetical protein